MTKKRKKNFKCAIEFWHTFHFRFHKFHVCNNSLFLPSFFFWTWSLFPFPFKNHCYLHRSLRWATTTNTIFYTFFASYTFHESQGTKCKNANLQQTGQHVYRSMSAISTVSFALQNLTTWKITLFTFPSEKCDIFTSCRARGRSTSLSKYNQTRINQPSPGKWQVAAY